MPLDFETRNAVPAAGDSFLRRRTAIWRSNRRLVFASIAMAATAAWLGGLDNASAELSQALFLGAIGSGVFAVGRIVFALHRLYRCPQCGVVPYQALVDYKYVGLGPTRAEFMSPSRCPGCGMRLR